MTDYFALLNEPRRPWLDPDSLKAKFLARSAEAHPDRANAADKEAANQGFANLNAAYTCLREPRTRLQHLLELELGAKPKDLQQIPDDLAEVFMDIAKLCRETDEFLAQKAKTSSPLLQAQMFERGQEWSEKLLVRQQAVSVRQDKLIAALQIADKVWLETPADAPARGGLMENLTEIWRLLSFLARWTSQLQERITRLIL